MTHSRWGESSIPNPLENLVEAVLARFPGKVNAQAAPLAETGDRGVTFMPRNDRGAPVFCMYDGRGDGDDSFYIEVGSVLSEEFDESFDEDAHEWALALISNIGRFGLFSIVVNNSRGQVRRTDTFAPESQAERDSVSLGQFEVMKAQYEPW